MISSSHRTRPPLAWRVTVICAALVFAAPMLAILVRPQVALAGPTVKVRVEGESSTLLPLTTVTLEKPEPVSGCPANSANAAIDLAVNGNWDHGEEEGSSGDFTQTILGETHAFTHESDTWAVWIDDKWAGGICEDLLSEGQELLLVADHEPAPYAPTVLPLVLSGVPSSVVTGVPFNVTVSRIHTRPGTFPEIGEGTPEPEAAVTVSGAGVSALTNANGLATLTLSAPGSYALAAHEPGAAPSVPVAVCVRRSGESACGVSGSTGASNGSSPAGNASPVVPSYKGPYAIVPYLNSLTDGHVYKHGHAPRVLSGSVFAHTTVSSVSLTLRRSYRHRCYSFDGVTTRFVHARCGTGHPFEVSSNGTFSYLLPSALAPGRYVLDIEASDAAGNRTALARGTSRIVFYVR
jgi:hypothetical protein